MAPLRVRIARTRGRSFLPCGLQRFQRRAEEVGLLIRCSRSLELELAS